MRNFRKYVFFIFFPCFRCYNIDVNVQPNNVAYLISQTFF